MSMARMNVWNFLIGIFLVHTVVSSAYGQCVEFDSIKCGDLVEEAVGCADMECVWWQPGQFPNGRWLCPDLIGKEVVDDTVEATIPVNGEGTQYISFGETKHCSVVYDCNCRHVLPTQGGGNCQTDGEGQEDDMFTDQEPGNAGDHDIAIICTYSEL